nr:TonB-dependent receptor [Methylocucumis oryzae]
MYDYQNWSLRVAYNWRDKFLSGTANIVGIGVLPLYTEAYDWLDASLIYKVNSHLSLSIEGLNILDTVRKSYYETPERPQNVLLNDTQVIGSITLRY